MGGAAQQPGVGRVLGEQRLVLGQRELVLALEAGELEGEHRQGAADRVEVGARRRPVRLDLRRLVADRPVDRAVAVDVPDAAHVDELELLFGLDDVVRLEVAVDEPAVVQVAEGGQDLQRVGERVRERHRAAALSRLEADLLERLAAHVLHHDVARGLAVAAAGVLNEVVDPHDVRVLKLGEEPPLGDRRLHRVGVAGVQQALHRHPAVGDVAVPAQVDPAEAAVREAAKHLVLPGDELAGHQLGAEGVPGAAVRAEPLGQAGPAVARLADRLAAVAAEPPVLRDLRVGEHGRRRVERRNGRHRDEAGAELAPR